MHPPAQPLALTISETRAAGISFFSRRLAACSLFVLDIPTQVRQIGQGIAAVINTGVSSAGRTACEPSLKAYIRGRYLPTVLRSGPYRFFFYSADRGEPPHVHVEHQSKIAKIWIDPVRIADGGSFRRSRLREIERLTSENTVSLLEAWNDFFGR